MTLILCFWGSPDRAGNLFAVDHEGNIWTSFEIVYNQIFLGHMYYSSKKINVQHHKYCMVNGFTDFFKVGYEVIG